MVSARKGDVCEWSSAALGLRGGRGVTSGDVCWARPAVTNSPTPDGANDSHYSLDNTPGILNTQPGLSDCWQLGEVTNGLFPFLRLGRENFSIQSK